MSNIYATVLDSTSGDEGSMPYEVVDSEIDLYWDIAHLMYREIEANSGRGKPLVFIVPVGPVFQYRRFVKLFHERPIDLSDAHFFFMDEYLNENHDFIDKESPLSFRGFVDRELTTPLTELKALSDRQVYFPNPKEPGRFDEEIAALGGADVCIAGVGINGHLAFNEPPLKHGEMSDEEFMRLPSRIVRLARETQAMNANTAMGGAYELIPDYAVTVGFRRIMESKKIRLYLNRPWQAAVARKILFGERSCTFPASLVSSHPDVHMTLTGLVAKKPSLGLK